MPASTPLPDTSTSATSSVCRRRSGWRRGSRRRTTRRRRSAARPRPTSPRAAPASRPGRAAGRAGRPASSRRGCPARPSRPRDSGEQQHDRRGDATRRRTGPATLRLAVRGLEYDHRRDDDVEQQQAAHAEQEAADEHGQRASIATREPGARLLMLRTPRRHRAQAEREQREAVGVQDVPPHQRRGSPPQRRPAAAAARSVGGHAQTVPIVTAGHCAGCRQPSRPAPDGRRQPGRTRQARGDCGCALGRSGRQAA